MEFEDARRRMVDEQLKARGLRDKRLLEAFARVPRHLFVPDELRAEAYADHPLPIGLGQTISQPYMVALMIHWLRLQGHERVLEIGTGSGYETAILARLALDVYSVERIPELLVRAQARLAEVGYHNVQFTTGNGSLGWKEYAPYDGIIMSAAAPDVPSPLVDQLAEGGRMVIPVGLPQQQTLLAVEKRGGRITRRPLTSCVFVPLVGEHGWPVQDVPP
jgi:protein-L-isoaspartate(D-aspartate) O-methyltransferase